MRRGRPARPPAARDALAATAHELRSSLNSIHTWAHLLEVRVGPSAEPSVRRALDGIHAGIRAHVQLIENLLEARAGDPPDGKPATKARVEARGKPTRTEER